MQLALELTEADAPKTRVVEARPVERLVMCGIPAKKPKMSTDAWVKKLNAMAREMDSMCDGLHPSAWLETTRTLRAKYKALAGAELESDT